MQLDQAAPLVGAEWRGQQGTVADRITSVLARVPEPGEEFDIDGLHVELEALEAGAITSVIVGDRPRQEENGA